MPKNALETLDAANLVDAERWKALVSNSPIPDAYYLPAYARANSEIEHSDPLALVAGPNSRKFLVPLLVRRSPPSSTAPESIGPTHLLLTAMVVSCSFQASQRMTAISSIFSMTFTIGALIVTSFAAYCVCTRFCVSTNGSRQMRNFPGHRSGEPPPQSTLRNGTTFATGHPPCEKTGVQT